MGFGAFWVWKKYKSGDDERNLIFFCHWLGPPAPSPQTTPVDPVSFTDLNDSKRLLIYARIVRPIDEQIGFSFHRRVDLGVFCASCHRRRRRRGRGARAAPKKFGKKNSGNFYVKFGHFSGKNHVKLGNFDNFSGKYHKNSGILNIFRARIM